MPIVFENRWMGIPEVFGSEIVCVLHAVLRLAWARLTGKPVNGLGNAVSADRQG